MFTHKQIIIALVSASSIALSACGGAGGGVAPIPASPSSPLPPTTPTQPSPTPPPNPTPPPLPSGAIGLTGGPFSTYSAGPNGDGGSRGKDVVAISYSAGANTYTFSAPGVGPGQLVDTTIGSGGWQTGSTTWQNIDNTTSRVIGSPGTSETATVSLDWAAPPYADSGLTYTSFGSWSSGSGNPASFFVYGTPTLPENVPVTGTASYSGNIRGTVSGSNDYGLFGGIKFLFDFAAASLSGSMTPATTNGWDTQPLDSYTFRDTIFAKGSATFSGAFNVPGSTAPSGFDGRFTGPSATELMGNFTAPYLSPNDHTWQTMVGVFAGRKYP